MKREPNRSQHEWPGIPRLQSWEGRQTVLDFFGFGDWHLIKRTELKGPNWKVAYDGYLDFYHLPYLHRNSFGACNVFCVVNIRPTRWAGFKGSRPDWLVRLRRAS